MDNPPIDILEIASVAHYCAWERLQAIGCMQDSPKADRLWRDAMIRLDLAERDVNAAHQLAVEIGMNMP